MAIEFQYKGTTWRADTAEEAVALRNELAKSDTVSPPHHEAMDQAMAFWTLDRFMDVLSGIGDCQRRLLVAVRAKPAITSMELVEELELDSEVALAGVISGLSKQLRQLGVELNQVLAIHVNWSGKRKIRKFILDDFFVGVAEEQNWPEAWEKRTKARKTSI